MKITTQWIEPLAQGEKEACVEIKAFAQGDKILTLFMCEQERCFRYAVSEQGREIAAVSPLELEGVPPVAFLEDARRIVQDAFARRVDFPNGQYKLSLLQRGYGGGKWEMATGAVTTAAGVGAAVACGPSLLVGMATGAMISAGWEMMSVGWKRKEDRFDAEFGLGALKGGASGAVTGVLGGGVGGKVVQRLGASRVVAKQAIHGAVNATAGVAKTAIEAGIESRSNDPKVRQAAGEKLSARSLAASAVGSALGGLAGAHVGKKAADISNRAARTAATALGSMTAGGTAGAAGGVAAAGAINTLQGKEFLEGAGSSALTGGSAGVLTAAMAASRVSKKYVGLREKREKLAQIEQERRAQWEKDQTLKQKEAISPDSRSKTYADALDSKNKAPPAEKPPEHEALKKALKENKKKFKWLGAQSAQSVNGDAVQEGLQREMDMFRLKDAILRDPLSATEATWKSISEMKVGGILQIPSADGGIAILHRRGDELFELTGERAVQFLSQGPEQGAHLLGRGIDMSSPDAAERLYAHIQHGYQQIQQSEIARHMARAPERVREAAAHWIPPEFTAEEALRIQQIFERAMQSFRNLNLPEMEERIHDAASSYSRLLQELQY